MRVSFSCQGMECFYQFFFQFILSMNASFSALVHLSSSLSHCYIVIGIPTIDCYVYCQHMCVHRAEFMFMVPLLSCFSYICPFTLAICLSIIRLQLLKISFSAFACLLVFSLSSIQWYHFFVVAV